ncbi:EscI/YscI/HrpB family type III secretion system inner rod protein [Herbaspirillum sp. LeCh32-8]|uniref:EscI/YscI/HrpB family type III secretion system inner rod protein n=1 Tax=Herbaspirillum sp. LeCh32-8 TaxID=2821356 RepID=UPI001AE1B102|nr:EscI/YscI/HrpB family type III secretion system inner rod protein [Herbaspirillum sp. LeCh32-8]MBP0597306.1 EscI/YscI/HrpB family type III secretion system inner rod protein [Herbaspirillum sp. LeCh32-8]
MQQASWQQSVTLNDPAAGGATRGAGIHIEVQPGEAEHFKTMFEQYLNKDAMRLKPNTHSLGSALAQRTSSLASEVKQDQLYVSKLLEQATRTGDSMQLMKAMMALSDYQIRVQTISKCVSKASTSVDSLTKLQ